MNIRSSFIPHNFRNKYLKNVGTYIAGSSSIIEGGSTGSKIDVIDNLETSSKEKALSANMGRVLNEKKIEDGGTVSNLTIENLSATTFTSNNSTITSLSASTIESNKLISDSVATDRITSKVFQSGNKGFSIDSAGNAEFNDIIARGTFSVNTINYNKINATNGEVWITDAAQIISIDDSIKQVEVTENVFQTGDILLCQVFSGNNIKRCQIQIVSAITSSTESALYSYINIENSDQLKVSDTLVRLNNNTDADRQQYIKLSPYSGSKIDIIDNDDVSVRLGSLSGITDEVFGTLSGYGLFAKDAYLRGDFATSTCRFNSDGSGNICNNMMNWDAAGNFNFNASISADKISGGTISSDLIEVNEVVNEPHWALKKDGSGYLSNSAITWDTTGNLTLKLGTKKEFKTIDINNYESTSFILDLNNGYNFIFTKSMDNSDRTIQLPTDKSLDGIDVELVFRGNPGIIYVTTNRSYGFKYNAAWVNKVTLGTRDIRLKLAARINANKTYIEWWIENDSAFDLYSKISAKRYDYCENKYYN